MAGGSTRAVETVKDVKATVIGASSVRFKAEVELGDELLDALGDELDRLEGEIRHAVPRAHHVDLEAD